MASPWLLVPLVFLILLAYLGSAVLIGKWIKGRTCPWERDEDDEFWDEFWQQGPTHTINPDLDKDKEL